LSDRRNHIRAAPVRQISDKTLVQSIADGNKAALKPVYSCHRRRVQFLLCVSRARIRRRMRHA
jgi:hypothetical protein